ncbi:hypothetical protein OUZ56_003224 [Daphnia magna]|uniref:Uncharacterized protein n=1 Tax=Daphnia magna TaxID=35525 RepID=A0ABR0A838_9CRUS|nr:hypothetical protein OUZ56_003224 [Daphnia magna]
MLDGGVEGDLIVTICGVETGEEATFTVDFSRVGACGRHIAEVYHLHCGSLPMVPPTPKIIQLTLYFSAVAKRNRQRTVYIKGDGIVAKLDHHVRTDYLPQTVVSVEYCLEFRYESRFDNGNLLLTGLQWNINVTEKGTTGWGHSVVRG